MAACQITPNSEWILAKVLHHDVGTGMYKLADEDIESNKSAFRVRQSEKSWCLGVCVSCLTIYFGLSPL